MPEVEEKCLLIACTGLFAALYVTLIIVFHPISFLQIQVRVANVLRGIVPVFGPSAIVGLTLGVFLGNLTSPLGPIDLLSAIPTLIGLIIIFLLRRFKGKGVFTGLVVYDILIAIWVAYMLNLVFYVPYWITVLYVFMGSFVSSIGAYLLYLALTKPAVIKALKRLGVKIYIET